jgi:hypothetical protein
LQAAQLVPLGAPVPDQQQLSHEPAAGVRIADERSREEQ